MIKPTFDLLGNVILVKFPYNVGKNEKKKFAQKLLREHKSAKTILEKIGKFKGLLRKQKTKFLLGIRTKEVLYRENNCVFRFNIDSTYFSPRLSNERKEIAGKIKKGDWVLVMFAGVSPFSIAIAKNSKAKKVYSVEINKEANKYAKINVQLNNLKNKVETIQGNVKNFVEKLSRRPDSIQPLKNINVKSRGLNKIPRKFDVIVMPRPQLKESFLKEAFSLSKTGKRGTKIFYYDFCLDSEKEKIIEKIKIEAKKAKKKIKITKIKNAGEIGARKFRVRVDFEVH